MAAVEAELGIGSTCCGGDEDAQKEQKVSSVTREEALLQSGLACPICMEFFCEPLLLGCGHAFCRLCLLKTSRLAPDGRQCPNCRSPIQLEDPAGHPTDEALRMRVLEIVPAEEVAARTAADKHALVELAAQAQTRLPVFYMYGNATRVGQEVCLHFFEPRYRILIRRAWEGNRRFLCTQQEPRVGDRALIVEVDSAFFRRDGRADVHVRGVEVTTLRDVAVEDGADSLYYAEVEAPAASVSREPASRAQRQRPGPPTRGTPSNAEARALAVQYILMTYMRDSMHVPYEGSREETTRCAEVYLKVVQGCLNAARRLCGRPAIAF